MIFVLWCFLHVITMIVVGQLTPRRKFFYLSLSECLIVFLWYAVPLSSLLTSTDPSPLHFTIGFALYMLGASLLTWARRVNPYFRPQILMPPEVIKSGPYKWLKHPSYVAMVAMALGSALMVRAHFIGYLALAVYSLILMLRAQEEDRLITRQVAGVEPASLTTRTPH